VLSERKNWVYVKDQVNFAKTKVPNTKKHTQSNPNFCAQSLKLLFGIHLFCKKKLLDYLFKVSLIKNLFSGNKRLMSLNCRWFMSSTSLLATWRMINVPPNCRLSQSASDIPLRHCSTSKPSRVFSLKKTLRKHEIILIVFLVAMFPQFEGYF